MQQSHGIGYAEYNRNLDNRLMVEKQREEDHRRSLEIMSSLTSKIHRQ